MKTISAGELPGIRAAKLAFEEEELEAGVRAKALFFVFVFVFFYGSRGDVVFWSATRRCSCSLSKPLLSQLPSLSLSL